MNRENKRKQYEKGYYQVNPCSDSFVCKVCGRLMTPEKAGTRRPRLRLRGHHGAGGRMGAQGRRVGNYSPLPPLRRAPLQSGGRR